MKQINQGDIYLANLNPVKGHEQAGLRLVLILQNNILNRHLNTVIIAPVTSNLSAKGFLTTHFIKKKAGLDQDSLALLFQVRTIDKSRLMKEIGRISLAEFAELKMKLGRVF